MFQIGFSPSNAAATAGFLAEHETSDPGEFAAFFAGWPEWMLDIELTVAPDEIQLAN
jgi:hypothetical protein